MTSYEQSILDRSFIPPEPKEVGTREVKVICTFITYLEVPADLENYSDIKEWIKENYTNSYILEDGELFIEDIEK